MCIGEDDEDDDGNPHSFPEYDRMGRPMGREKSQQRSENLIRKLRLKERIIRKYQCWVLVGQYSFMGCLVYHSLGIQ